LAEQDGADATSGTEERISAQAARTIRFQILNATELKLERVSTVWKGDWRNPPENMNFFEYADYTLLSTEGNAWGKVTYAMGTSGYQLVVDASNGVTRSEYANCGILTADGTPTSDSGWQCRVQWADTLDMDFYTILEPVSVPTTELTPITFPSAGHAARACEAQTPEIHFPFVTCEASNVRNIEQKLLPEEVVSEYLVNCTSSPSQQSVWRQVAKSTMVSWTGTLGIRMSLGPSNPAANLIFKGVDVYMENSHSRAWTTTLTKTDQTTAVAQPGEMAWIGTSLMAQSVTADYSMTIGKHHYQLTDITVTAPLTDALERSVTVTRSQPIGPGMCDSRHSNTVWKTPVPSFSPEAGQVVSLALRGSNQRELAPNADGPANSEIGLRQADDSRNNLWFLQLDPTSTGNSSEVFQLVSLAEVDAGCLTVPAGAGSVAKTAPCDTVNAGAAGQLWEFDADLADGGYVVRSVSDGRAVTVDAHEIGTSAHLRHVSEASKWLLAP
jgi:hypothetical protein